MKRILYFLIPGFYVLHVISLMCSMAGTEFFGWGGFVLIIFAAIYERIVNKKSLFVAHPFNKYILIFGLAITISVMLSPLLSAAERPWHFYVGRLRYLLLFFYHVTALTYFVNFRKLIKWLPAFVLPVLLLYIFESMAGVRLVGGGEKVINWSWNFSRGINGYFVHYIEFATIFELFTFLMLPFLFFKEYGLKYKLFLGITVAVALFSMTVSGTRAFFMVLPLVLIIQTLFSHTKKGFIVVLLLVIATPFVAYKVSPFLRHRKDFTVANMNKLGDPYRYNLWRAHLLMFKDHPITGAGFYMPIEKGFIEPYYKELKTKKKETYRGTTLAHNSYIDMLSGAGLLGFLSFLLMSVMLFKYLLIGRARSIEFKNGFAETLSVGLIGALSSLYINMLVDSGFLYIKVSYAFIFIAGLCIYLSNFFGLYNRQYLSKAEQSSRKKKQ